MKHFNLVLFFLLLVNVVNGQNLSKIMIRQVKENAIVDSLLERHLKMFSRRKLIKTSSIFIFIKTNESIKLTAYSVFFADSINQNKIFTNDKVFLKKKYFGYFEYQGHLVLLSGDNDGNGFFKEEKNERHFSINFIEYSQGKGHPDVNGLSYILENRKFRLITEPGD